MSVAARRDYSLIGDNARLALEHGLARALLYHTDVPRRHMKELTRPAEAPAVRDTVISFALLGAFGFAGYSFWGGWECVPFFACYGVLYGSASDSGWHETGRGTAFRTTWLNDALYQIASFMTLREPAVSRWSHAPQSYRHDYRWTRPRDRCDATTGCLEADAGILALRAALDTQVGVARHAADRLTSEEATNIPESERGGCTARHASGWRSTQM
jgi:hypothetical protein